MNSDSGLTETYAQVRDSVISAKTSVTRAVNSAMVFAYWEIGKQISLVTGDGRAEYGKYVISYLAERLTAEFGSGFSERNLRNMRKFYETFPIRQTLSAELSWSHYQHLLRITDEKARNFYLTESVSANWSVRQLERQISTLYYERLLISQDKKSVAAKVEKTNSKPEYETILRDPYVLEFLNLPPNPAFYEKDLEEALISNMQKFLLELGRGFCFEARQKRITFDGQHFFIDLVFYNYLLRCFVLVDLKLGTLTHQDLGQMQMYVNYYTRKLMNEGDNPPIGIILCADKSDTVVKYTLPEGESQIFAAKYKLYLPTEEELKRELLDEFKVMCSMTEYKRNSA